METEQELRPIRRLYNTIVGSMLFWILGPFLILAQISSCLGIYYQEGQDYHPAEPGWSYDQCMRDLRAPIFDRNPDMIDLPEDLEFRVRQECSEHARQHIRP